MAPLDDSPRHAMHKPQRLSWDPRPILADLKAGMQTQRSRTDLPEPGTEPPGDATVSQPTVDAGMSDPAGADGARVGGSAMVHAPVEGKDHKNLRRAAEAAEAAAAQAAGAASQAAITADRATSDARAAREDAAAANAAANATLAGLRTAREEITVLHQALERVQARARRDAVIAWAVAGIALIVASVGLIVG
ncbi:hypothetical protein [Myceligenerans indicum]|uniref:Uncharacterized protein n=1 Tax=Myceligenerans indicum TaxID=2593663 RepID=A0ABS1LRE4_9MICO|nr:hypothetical protein [Myceligenerans indicum]MBL0888877.1 hypothetical protein [Myceligenerans indicum]